MRISPAEVARAFERACLTELQALKPGNVHVHAAGHGMNVAQFIASARAAAPIIGRAGLDVGARIEQAVAASRAAAGCNTNLGIILLAAPLAQAALDPSGSGDFAQRLRAVLAGLTVADAAAAYRAIRMAAPGGLGASARHDVRDEPAVTLLEAMREAAERDRIATEYAEGFPTVLDFGVPQVRTLAAGGAGPVEIAERLYLSILSRFPDSHIQRKHGMETALSIQATARTLLHDSLSEGSAIPHRARLLAFDREMKQSGLNPGTSADLTVATLLAADLADTVAMAVPRVQVPVPNR